MIKNKRLLLMQLRHCSAVSDGALQLGSAFHMYRLAFERVSHQFQRHANYVTQLTNPAC